ncbi:hypothetical protein A4G28_22490 [Mycobacterium ostraviense]|uniref:Uncharacterized protein n=1 Tax=Mycobacterium ostraviense TaxID=2738409 RepID=A0A163RPT5_9MYCO|nr:hypothetical protein A4G28_22490 [Mycobacterium ostraviense]
MLGSKIRAATHMRASKQQAPAIVVIPESYSKRPRDIGNSANDGPAGVPGSDPALLVAPPGMVHSPVSA